MEFAGAVERRWWLIGAGVVAQLVGGAMVAVAWSDRSKVAIGAGDYKLDQLFAGTLIVWVGFWVALIGVIAIASRFLAYRDVAATASGPVRWRPGPPQLDPADVAADRRPFIKHEDDSQVVADVRRACGRGVRPAGLQRIISKAASEGRLNDNDRVMVQALIDEAKLRPLTPLAPDDFL